MTKYVGCGNTGCGVFKRGYIIRKKMPKNQHTQRNLLNFENWLCNYLLDNFAITITGPLALVKMFHTELKCEI